MESLSALWGMLFTWPVLLILCATLGLAPFMPEPHIVEKLRMLAAGDLRRPVDVFDMLLHGTPWLLLVAKGVLSAMGK
jgi:hypothetical protein